MTITFDLENVENGLVEISISDPELIKSIIDPFIYFRDKNIDVEDVNYFQSELFKVLGQYEDSIGIISSTLSFVLLIGSGVTGVYLMKLFQMIDYLLFISVKHPTNLVVFLSIFNATFLDYLPNLFKRTDFGECGNIGEKFFDSGLSCHFLHNSGGIMFLFIGMGIAKFLSEIFQRTTKSSTIKCKKEN